MILMERYNSDQKPHLFWNDVENLNLSLSLSLRSTGENLNEINSKMKIMHEVEHLNEIYFKMKIMHEWKVEFKNDEKLYFHSIGFIT